MKLIPKTPREFINPILSQKSIASCDFNAFKLALKKYVADVNQQKECRESEPNIVAGALMPFLQVLSTDKFRVSIEPKFLS